MGTCMKLLIAQHQLSDFGGSEVITLELSRYFTAKGWRVDILTHFYGEPIRSEFLKLKGARVFTDPEELATNYDIVWLHHQLFPPSLKKIVSTGRRRPTIIFNHMSPYEPLEYPRFAAIENALADIVLANSQETYDMLISAGVKKDLLTIIGNPAPDEFARKTTKTHRQLQTLLAVSNHFPPEAIEALDLLEKSGVQIHRVGASFDNKTLVNPTMISRADAVISIGKTVQFSLLSRVPVYVYDHFGGPGYLTRDNFEMTRLHNFSGRGFTKKKPEDIAEEVVRDYASARREIDALANDTSQTFLFSAKIEECLQLAKRHNEKHSRPNVPTEEWEAMLANNRLLKRTFLASMNSSALSDAKDDLEHRLSAAQTDLQAAHIHINHLAQRLNRKPVKIVERSYAYLLRQRAFRILIKSPQLFKKNGQLRERLKGQLRLSYGSLPFFYRSLPGKNKQRPLKIIGMIRERNEALILKDSLDHLSSFVDGIIVFDDASTDSSVSIALDHPAVVEVIVNKKWRANRTWEETSNRRLLMKKAQNYSPEWFFYADADERFEGNIRHFLTKLCPPDVSGIRISLFDAYMTKNDALPFQTGDHLLGFRKSFGVERRDILMIWRNDGSAAYIQPDSREPSGIPESKIITKFFCQHYGKSISVEHWDETCNYYVDHFPQYSKKWKQRLGKAIHTKSDFDTQLYPWAEVKNRGVKIN